MSNNMNDLSSWVSKLDGTKVIAVHSSGTLPIVLQNYFPTNWDTVVYSISVGEFKKRKMAKVVRNSLHWGKIIGVLEQLELKLIQPGDAHYQAPPSRNDSRSYHKNYLLATSKDSFEGYDVLDYKVYYVTPRSEEDSDIFDGFVRFDIPELNTFAPPGDGWSYGP